MARESNSWKGKGVLKALQFKRYWDLERSGQKAGLKKMQ